MKTSIKNRWLLTALITGLGFFLAPCAHAQFQWANRVASANNWPEGEPNTGLALDTNDNCYVTGFFDDTNNFGGVTLTNQSTGGSDIFVVKYNSVGALQWAQRAGGSAGNFNYGRGIGVDTNGNIYVAGGYQSPATFGSINLPATLGEEFFLAKYNSAGAVQWVRTSIGGSDDNDGVGLTVDGAGNSYALAVLDHSGTSLTFGSVTVTANNGGTTFLILVKYDNTGTAQWAKLFDSSQETYGSKLAVDAAGNVYVRGTFFSDMTIGTSNLVVSPANETENMFIAKFNNSGALIWVQQPIGGNAGEGGVAVDPAGNVYVTGAFNTNMVFGGGITLTNMANTNALFGDAFLAKYNSAGAIQWAQSAGGTNGGFYWDVALDAQTNIYAAGYLGSNAVVAKYSPAGTYQWTYSASGPPASPVSSGVDKCAVDSAGHCYLNGFYQGTATFGATTLQPQETWNFFLTQVSPVLAVTTTSLPNGTVGVAYNQTLTASGGQTPYAWTNISGGLPPGLTLATNGMISGTPTTAVTTNFTVQVKDATNGIATQVLTLTVVVPNLVLNGGFETGDFTGWTLSGDTSYTLVDNGSASGIQPHSGTYVAELGTTSARGFISQTLSTVAGQSYLLSLWLNNLDGLTPNELLVSWNGNAILDQVDLPAIGWTNIQFVVAATGTSTVLQFGFRDDPAYLGLDDISLVSSRPTPIVVTTSLPNGTNGVAYNQILTAFGGQTPYTWTNSSSVLPAGLVLANNGVISGVPTNNGTSNFTVKVTDALSATATQTLTLTVGSPSSVAIQPTNNSVTVMVGSNATIFASVTGTGPFSYQWQLNGVNLLNGIITTIAGNGYGAPSSGGFSGDGGVATNAELAGPCSVAVDTNGNLLLADYYNSRIRKVGTNGTINTIAGGGNNGLAAR